MTINKKGLRAVKFHQALSFSRVFAKTSGPNNGQTLFWPGCAMIGHNPGLTLMVYQYLQTIYPDVRLTTFCCGYPAASLVKQGLVLDKTLQKYQGQLRANLKDIATVITACPNCTLRLKQNQGVRVVSIWQILSDNFPIESINKLADSKKSLIIHDPCPTAKDVETQQAFRLVMAKLGLTWQEFMGYPGSSPCCGHKNMAMSLRPQAATAIAKARVMQSPDTNILTYCYACRGIFRACGSESSHGLELVFENEIALPKKQNSWQNRRQFAKKI